MCEQFLTELEKNLYRLNREDRENIIQFYKEYFEDAGYENEQSVIEELGDPKKLAEEITVCHCSKFENEKAPLSKKLEDNIESIHLEATSANVRILPSEFDFIEYKTENISERDVKVKIEKGVLYIKEKSIFSLHKKSFSDFFKNIPFTETYNETAKRKLDIYIPKNCVLQKAKLNVKLGSIKIENVKIDKIEGYTVCGNFNVLNVLCKKTLLNTSAGSITLSSLKVKYIKLQSSAGSIVLKNIEVGKLFVSTGAGNTVINDVIAVQIYINSGAGIISSCNLKNIRGKFFTGAGKIEFSEANLRNSVISASVGSIKFRGSLKERAELSSSFGKIDLDLKDSIEEYYIKVCSKGSFILNDKTIKILGNVKRIGNEDAENRVKLDTNFGKIKIKTK